MQSQKHSDYIHSLIFIAITFPLVDFDFLPTQQDIKYCLFLHTHQSLTPYLSEQNSSEHNKTRAMASAIISWNSYISLQNKDACVSMYCTQHDTCRKRLVEGKQHAHNSTWQSWPRLTSVRQWHTHLGPFTIEVLRKNQDWEHPSNFNQWFAFLDRHLDYVPTMYPVLASFVEEKILESPCSQVYWYVPSASLISDLRQTWPAFQFLRLKPKKIT